MVLMRAYRWETGKAYFFKFNARKMKLAYSDPAWKVDQELIIRFVKKLHFGKVYFAYFGQIRQDSYNFGTLIHYTLYEYLEDCFGNPMTIHKKLTGYTYDHIAMAFTLWGASRLEDFFPSWNAS